jgi:hypothetical protein
MKKFLLAFLFINIAGGVNPFMLAAEQKVTIVEPANREKVTSPVKVCMEVDDLIVEPKNMASDNTAYDGKGHHHILFNSLPTDLSKPIGKDEIHLGDGSSCGTFELKPGRHVIISLFAYGNHVPYDPVISDKIIITVKKSKNIGLR